MKIALNSALAKLAKEINECAGHHLPIHPALHAAKPRLVKEYKTAAAIGPFNVMEIADIPEFDYQAPVIYVGPFSFKYGSDGNFVEKICKVAGAAFIDATSPKYEFIFPTNGNFIDTLERVTELYDLTSYVERYKTVFGYTIPEITADKIIRDFTDIYFPDLNTVNPTIEQDN